MDLFDLGTISWWESQCYYHALAHLGREGLIICRPASPYVCLGLHDDLEQEIDQDYCCFQDLPVFRRETGGGVVYLDDQQIFFQLVLRRDNSRLPLRRTNYYPQFLEPAIGVYQHFGMPAQVREPADLTVEGRKCSGNACGDIGSSVAYVGNIMLDFDFQAMSRVLKVPHPDFSDQFRTAMLNHMTTLKAWGHVQVEYQLVASLLVEGFAKQWGDMRNCGLDEAMLIKAQELYRRSMATEWTMMPGRRSRERNIKVAEGVYLLERRLDSNISVAVLVRDGKVTDLRCIGDEDPAEARWHNIIGQVWDEELLIRVLVDKRRIS